MSALGKKGVLDLASLLTRGLEKCSISPITHINIPSEQLILTKLSELRILLIASIVKLLEDRPDSIIPHLATIMPSLLLLLNTPSDVRGIRVMLLALQALMSLATSTHPVMQKPFKSYKSEVLFYLVHPLDSPSIQIRQAAVQVRNFCFVAE